MKTIVITSPATDAGKTFIACNLAAAAAERGVATALLDFDLAVGDIVRALGLEEEARRPHPTVVSWKDYRDPAAAALKGPGGVAVFPRPENPFEVISRGDVEAFLNYLANSFEAVVVDAGADVGSECWGVLAAAADEVLLVTDCDEKAIFRVKQFLAKYGPVVAGKCRLVVNRREAASRYSPRDMGRILCSTGIAFKGVSEIPFDPGARRGGVPSLDQKSAAGKAMRGLAVAAFGFAPGKMPAQEKRLPILTRFRQGLACAPMADQASSDAGERAALYPAGAPEGAASTKKRDATWGGPAGSSPPGTPVGKPAASGMGPARPARSEKEGRDVAFWRKWFKRGDASENQKTAAVKEGQPPAEKTSMVFKAASGTDGAPQREPRRPSGGGVKPEPNVSPGLPAVTVENTLLPVQPPVVFLFGRRSESLAGAAAGRGFRPVTGTPTREMRPAVVIADVELLPSLGDPGCPVIGLSSGKLSDLLVSSEKAAVALNGEAALEFAAKACGIGSNSRGDERTRPDVAPPAVGSAGRAVAPYAGVAVPPPPRRGVVIAFYSGTQAQQGKTSLAINAAALMAEKGMAVCLVDFDTGKAGLTRLCGYTENHPPGCDLATFFERATPVRGPAGTSLVAAPLPEREWFPDPAQAGRLVADLAARYDAVVLDFGARLISPSVKAALRQCDRIFIVALPHRTAASTVARLRGQWLAEIGGERVAVIVNRVGYRDSNISPRNVAQLLGREDFFEIPDDPAVAAAEDGAARGKPYDPPSLKKKNPVRRALLYILESACITGRAAKEG